MNKFIKGDRVELLNANFSDLTKGGIYRIKSVTGRLIGIGNYMFVPSDIKLFKPAPRNTAVIKRTRNGGFRTTLVGKNGEVMYTSEVYTTKVKAIKTARQVVPDFIIVDKTK